MNLKEYRQSLQSNSDYVKAERELKLQFELANAVLRARLEKGWSQAELAEAVGTKQANISRIETGLANPTLAIIQKIGQVLDISIRFSQVQPSPTVTVTSSPKDKTTAILVPNWPGGGRGPHYEIKSQDTSLTEGNF